MQKIKGNKLRIALLSYRSKVTCGGQGIYIQGLTQALIDLGHEVDVISGPPYPNICSNAKLIKIPSLTIFENQSFFPKKWWRIFSSWANFNEWFLARLGIFSEPITFGKRVYQFFKHTSYKYDIVHDNQSLFYESLLIQKTHPFIATIHHPITKDYAIYKKHTHSLFASIGLRQWYRFLEMQKTVSKKLKYILTVSESSKEDISTDFLVNKQNISVLPLGINTDLFKPNENKVKRYHILSVCSSDTPLKGLIYLLKALNQLKKTFPQIRLTIVGKIKKNSLSYDYIQKNQLQHHLSIKYDLNEAELICAYQEAELVVIPSLYEGFGIPALEALSVGKPVVGTNTGAIAEIIGHTGILIDSANATQLYETISYLLEKPDEIKQRSTEARKRALHYFKWEIIAKKLELFYHKIIEDRKTLHAHY